MNMANNISNITPQIDQFDLNTGNGLMLELNQNKPGKHCLFIGLGGTGMHALMRLKRLVSQKYYAYDNSFVFLGIDSTDKAVPPAETAYNYMALNADERLVLSTAGIQQFFDKNTPKTKYIKSFLNDSVTHNGDEAGQKRQVGRTLLYNNISNVSQRLDAALGKLRSGGVSDGSIFIFAGVSGGTGSGLVLDMAYLLRSKLEGENFNNIYGMLFMPDVNASNPSLTNQNIRNDLFRNSYAAFKEIDYWMSIGERGDRFSVEYSENDKVDSTEKPFNYIFPIMATNMGQVKIDDPYNLCISTAAEVVCNFASYEKEGASFAAAFAATGSFVKVKTAYENAYSTNFAVYTNSFDYIGIGAAVMRMPFSAFSTYTMAEILKKLQNKTDTINIDKVKADVDRFIKPAQANNENNESVGLTVKAIKDAILKKLTSKPEFNAKMPQEKDQSEDPKFEIYRNELETYLKNVDLNIDKAIAELRNDIRGLLVGKDGKSGLLAKKFSNTDTGIYYFYEFLNNANYGLKGKFTDFESELKKALDRIKANMVTDEKLIEMERQSYENAGFFFAKSARIHYLEQINKSFDNKRDSIIFAKMVRLYKDIESDLFNKYSPVSSAVIDLISYMKEVMGKNDKLFTTQVAAENQNADYSWNLYEYNEIPTLFKKEAETAYGSKDDIDKQLQNASKLLVQNLFGEVYEIFNALESENWNNCTLTEQNFKIREILSKLLSDNEANGGFSKLFSFEENGMVKDKNMGYYIKLKAKGKSIDEFLTETAQRLFDNARILYNKVSAQSMPGQTIIAVYPDDGSDIAATGTVAANGTFQKALESCKVKPSLEHGKAKDSIIFVNMIQGLALFESVQLVKNSQNYYNIKDKVEGQSVHLVSTNSFNKSKYLSEYYDWRLLPSFIPKVTLSGAALVAREQEELPLDILFDEYMKRDLLRYDGTNINSPQFNYAKVGIISFDSNGKEYMPDGDNGEKRTYADVVLDTIGRAKVNSDMPISDIRDYGQKVAVLKDYITGKRRVDTKSLNITYGSRLTYDEMSFLSTDLFKDEYHKYDMGKAIFRGSLNIQRDLHAAKDFLDVVEKELARVAELTATYDSLITNLDFLVKAGLVGFIDIRDSIDVFFNEDKAANLNKPFVITQLANFLKTIDWAEKYSEIVDTKYDNLCRAKDFSHDDLATLKMFAKKQAASDNPSETDSVAASIFGEKLKKYEAEIAPFMKSKVSQV
jgi:hypothetical protein